MRFHRIRYAVRNELCFAWMMPLNSLNFLYSRWILLLIVFTQRMLPLLSICNKKAINRRFSSIRRLWIKNMHPKRTQKPFLRIRIAKPLSRPIDFISRPAYASIFLQCWPSLFGRIQLSQWVAWNMKTNSRKISHFKSSNHFSYSQTAYCAYVTDEKEATLTGTRAQLVASNYMRSFWTDCMWSVEFSLSMTSHRRLKFSQV